jgi:hypothetical protein
MFLYIDLTDIVWLWNMEDKDVSVQLSTGHSITSSL